MGGTLSGTTETVSGLSTNQSPLVIIGPSGSGKSSIVKVLCDQYGYTLIRTVTTRQKRDAFDTDHEFVSIDTFATMKQTGAFFGILEVFGAQYGLPKFNPANKSVLLLRAPALPEFLTRFPNAFIVEIDAPLPVLEQRLAARNTQDRFDPAMLTKEMALGSSFAQATFDTSLLSSEDVAQQIINLVEA